MVTDDEGVAPFLAQSSCLIVQAQQHSVDALCQVIELGIDGSDDPNAATMLGCAVPCIDEVAVNAEVGPTTHKIQPSMCCIVWNTSACFPSSWRDVMVSASAVSARASPEFLCTCCERDNNTITHISRSVRKRNFNVFVNRQTSYVL
jgi:hypothetical protein